MDTESIISGRWSKTFSACSAAISPTALLPPVKDAIFDGETIAMGNVGPDFYALMQSRGRPEYTQAEGRRELFYRRS